ncbi:Gfo/Idh/MocA family oxidoreductase [Paracoccus liaowanqingii]|uniref:Gfo/Idh/MocA family oxidoreductase n=1 Tax=Paracoccus liaowanqingii TaxID=2560053 RepID=A0A4Z1CBY6_9RHOB|nr:Gfo/Idh/MocA family oxidoreductase [Paracoccus liaowanqingii]TGN62364.1 Gfo/Idh/MocA family oxidoreductase [Paracoccus liaowanqingii]
MQTAVMVGCGAMSEGWLRAIDRINAAGLRIEVTGFVDLDPALARARADQSRTGPAGAGRTAAASGTDLAAMLRDLRPDMVFDMVVPQARPQVVATAFAAGCDVLSEKPLAGSLDEARALADLRDDAGRLHGVVQNRRHLPGIRRARAFLASGALGPVSEVHCDFFIAPHFGGFRERMMPKRGAPSTSCRVKNMPVPAPCCSASRGAWARMLSPACMTAIPGPGSRPWDRASTWTATALPRAPMRRARA